MKISRRKGKRILDQLPIPNCEVLMAVVESEDDPAVMVLLRAEGEIKFPPAKLKCIMDLPKEKLLEALLKGLN